MLADAQSVMEEVNRDFQAKTIDFQCTISDLTAELADEQEKYRRLRVRMASAHPPLVFAESESDEAPQTHTHMSLPGRLGSGPGGSDSSGDRWGSDLRSRTHI